MTDSKPGTDLPVSLQEEFAGLARYATSRQLAYLEAILEHGSGAAAARELGLNKATVNKAMIALRKKAARRGWAPAQDMTKETPEGFEVWGTSTLYDAGGKVSAQWVKTRQQKEMLLKMALEQVESVFSDPKYRVPTIDPRKGAVTTDLMTVYPMGDPHIGMYSWAEETGEDFDLNIAEENLISAMSRLIDCGPESETCLIANVGDFYHSDNMYNRTSRSGNSLDVDTRWAKVLHIGVRAMRACIELALQKHRSVHVINEIGNHDDHTAQVLTLALNLAYEQNPRVTFDLSPMKFHYHRFGKVLVGVTHGDTVKPEKLGELMASDQPQEWGETKHRYWYTGHIHSRKVYDLPGVMVESFRTLAAKDAWTHGAGYRSGRDMYAIVQHAEFGEVERHRVDVSML